MAAAKPPSPRGNLAKSANEGLSRMSLSLGPWYPVCTHWPAILPQDPNSMVLIPHRAVKGGLHRNGLYIQNVSCYRQIRHGILPAAGLHADEGQLLLPGHEHEESQ